MRILVGLAAGGSLDTMTRLVAEKLRVSLGQPVIVENRAGASGLIAIDALRAAPADGSVLMAAASGSITLLPNTFKSPRFDPTRDFSPVAQIAQIDFVLTINPGVPAKTVAEFAALAGRIRNTASSDRRREPLRICSRRSSLARRTSPPSTCPTRGTRRR